MKGGCQIYLEIKTQQGAIDAPVSFEISQRVERKFFNDYLQKSNRKQSFVRDMTVTKERRVYKLRNAPGLYRSVCPSLDKAARPDKQSKTVNPKKTTAFNRTQTVCIFQSIRVVDKRGLEEEGQTNDAG